MRFPTLRAAWLSVVTALTVASCESLTAPDCPLESGWHWEWNNNPSESSPGEYARSTGLFSLVLSHRSGRVVHYTGSLICPNTLQGTAAEGGSRNALVFYRDGEL